LLGIGPEREGDGKIVELLPTASGAPPLRPMIEPSSAMEWRKAFFEDAFYTLLTTALLMMLFSAVVAAID